jgi:hypothetical protein
MTYLEKYIINNFLLTGNFNNNIDDMGNVLLDLSIVSSSISSSASGSIFIAFDLQENNYDNQKITNLYDVNINTTNVSNNNEVIVVNDQLQTSYNNVVAENQALKDSLADLINVVEANPAQAEVMAAKDTIINLRIQLGQGKTPSDFSSDFPYAPL